MSDSCLQTALAHAGAVSRSGVAYRLVPKRYASPKDLLFGLGAARSGGRWNPPGVPAVYLSEDAALAVREVGYALSLGGEFSGFPKPPMMLFSVRFVLQRLLFVDVALARAACTSLQELLRPDFVRVLASGRIPASMRLGEAARAAGFEGLLVPSAQEPDAYNLVVFPDRLRAGSRLEPVLEEG